MQLFFWTAAIQVLGLPMANYAGLYKCSKSEYVIYKLKEMGKITETDVKQICHKFDMLDAGNCGKITLADLMETHH